MRPKFLQEVTVKRLAQKHSDGEGCEWVTTDHPRLPRVGHYIGHRCVSDGKWEWGPPDPLWGESLSYFQSQRYHEVWLIVFNDRENPARAFPEDVEW